MLDIGFAEIGLVVIVALLVIGPKQLPAVTRALGRCWGRWRRLSARVSQEVDEAMHDADKKSSTDRDAT